MVVGWGLERAVGLERVQQLSVGWVRAPVLGKVRVLETVLQVS
jgi:hypothetical protein